MKKFFILMIVAVLALTACSDKNPYAGRYLGTFTFVTNNITKDGTMLFVNNPLNPGLLLYSVVPLEQISPTVYKTNSANMDYITTLLQGIAGSNNIYDKTTEQIKNVKIETKFSGNHVDVDMYYEIVVLATLNTRISIVKFSGTR